MSEGIEKALLYTNPLYTGFKLGQAGVGAAGDVIGTTTGHIQEGIQEHKANDRYTEKEKHESRDAYAAGEHGLGTEILSQGWSDVKNNFANAATTIKTGANLAGDAVLAPARFALNTISHFFS